MMLIPICIIFAAVTSYFSFTLYQKQKDSATLLAEALSEKYGTQIKAELEVALDSARIISDMLEGLKEEGITDRKSVNTILSRILRNNTHFF